MYKVFLISIFIPFSLFAWDMAPFVPSCDMARYAKIVKVKNNFPSTLKDYSIKESGTSNAEYIEKILNPKIKCIYELENHNSELNSHLCPELKGDVSFIKNGTSSISSHTQKFEKIDNNKFKIVMNVDSDLGFIWQSGVCNLDSEKYFKNIKSKSSIQKLEKNKFLLVAEDDKSLTYYANPGYVVVLEKNEKLCKKNKNCELNIIQKKRLSSAILDADRKLHTDELL